MRGDETVLSLGQNSAKKVFEKSSRLWLRFEITWILSFEITGWQSCVNRTISVVCLTLGEKKKSLKIRRRKLWKKKARKIIKIILVVYNSGSIGWENITYGWARTKWPLVYHNYYRPHHHYWAGSYLRYLQTDQSPAITSARRPIRELVTTPDASRSAVIGRGF